MYRLLGDKPTGLVKLSEQITDQAMNALQEMDRYWKEVLKCVHLKECYKRFNMSL